MVVDASIQSMSLAEYAKVQQTLGEKIVKTGGVWWRRVRPRFFRPVALWRPYEAAEIVPPCHSLGGFQYVVANGDPANSTMNFLILDTVHEYSLGKLQHERRRVINRAAGRFEVHHIHDGRELKIEGYKAYRSFYARTHYSYREDRIHEGRFAEWAETVLRLPKALVLGGYREGRLLAVSVAYWVEQTLVYSTFFSDTDALREGVNELMFHTIREIVAGIPQIGEVLVRPYQGGNGMDRYYMLRGCKIARRPAFLTISPLARFALRSWSPDRYAMLCGRR